MRKKTADFILSYQHVGKEEICGFVKNVRNLPRLGRYFGKTPKNTQNLTMTNLAKITMGIKDVTCSVGGWRPEETDATAKGGWSGIK